MGREMLQMWDLDSAHRKLSMTVEGRNDQGTGDLEHSSGLRGDGAVRG